MTPPPAKRQKRNEYRKANTAVADDASEIRLPQKKFYRQRAHANPFSDHQLNYPLSPAHMDWSSHYPAFVDPEPSHTNLAGTRKLLKDVEVVDIGCGFGGLLIGLAPLLPESLIVGMEIRVSVLEYVTARIQALRSQQQKLRSSAIPSESSPAAQQPQQHHQQQLQATETAADAASPSSPDATGETLSLVPGNYQNISAIRSNTMKFFPNFFARHQLSKIFICFPDPHFKARKHKARIISETLNAEYAYALRPGGLLYTITDVEEYHHWVLRHFGEEGADAGQNAGVTELFERVSDEELEKDDCVRVMKEATEEGKKVTRNKGNKYVAVFRRKADPEWPA
ncbi:tRNA (guanine46-N7)-methyltransferase [Aspergillus clavatus NRRL 1]|uniref:tRNA (guanine-N(7)-)-methyltransferase n=1 Tax=Aspergillus clavatus (strain ATCC 1007 / CBS 513.65 / DSM 816 / NCTC 3887 / NRRL 1 / QM 1276 / 107) TaxID=344612 RepID=TRMB_ASPCL|nr:methyltransferase-like protein 1 [Aspergillus clavatus NRRL 1]A1CIF1.1 RecName: Full=tRNA (guanine-N(7)-)-methyltransferase; AltName: Full=Transfer RNA methyltransferase 8; AltName: Full=tRNA (guanine(46)-N(7))-methyltransferase; AltName: Full=tRNA(m7G46)-methyltransferase [Aspergillus clavatus NRRL 1]EAW10656.1 methyltransferase-like protein 1 [Aspergillus clavatus NRRL 1]